MSDNQDFILPDILVSRGREVVAANRAAGLRVAVAESCTGGLVSAALTEAAGSSDVFEAGFVTYSNEAKEEILGVSEEVIDTFGSVSIAAAWSMAQGILRKAEPTWPSRSPGSPARPEEASASRWARWFSRSPGAARIRAR